jgi:hypothetical protein
MTSRRPPGQGLNQGAAGGRWGGEATEDDAGPMHELSEATSGGPAPPRDRTVRVSPAELGGAGRARPGRRGAGPPAKTERAPSRAQGGAKDGQQAATGTGTGWRGARGEGPPEKEIDAAREPG